ncbi:MAG TPA: helix-turn-helix transcriptional regulator [Bryobacteraceae bacterium]
MAKADRRETRESDILSGELRAAFGRHCREARIKRGLSQQEVAAVSGMGQAIIAKTERGQKNITLETMMRILRVVDRAFARRLKGDLKARFGTNVRTARTEAGLSQAQLAERAGVRRAYISRIETGNGNVKLETVATISRAVGQDPNQLLGGVFDTRSTSGDPSVGA